MSIRQCAHDEVRDTLGARPAHSAVFSSRALIERIRRELGSIHEKIVAHRYLAAIEAGDLTWESLKIFEDQEYRQSQATSGASRYCSRVMVIFQAGYRDDLHVCFAVRRLDGLG